jgi:pilus assembly protein CpaB
MNAKKVAPLVLALILGLCAFYMALRVISKQKVVINQPNRPMVVVAKQNIEAGQPLSDDVLDKSEISSDTAPPGSFQTPAELNGRVATVPIVQGQVITQTLLAPIGAGAGLQAVIPMGMRAITLDMNEITGVAGNIMPGSHIDILQTFHDDKTGDQMSRTILQNVKVLAVGNRRNPNDPNQDPGSHSITVVVNPQDAETLELSSMTGRPRYALRNSNDLDLVETPGATLTELKGKESAQKEAENVVPVMNSLPPSTQPTQPLAYADPATRPTAPVQPATWTMHVIRGGAEEEVKFALHRPTAELLAPDGPLEPQ